MKSRNSVAVTYMDNLQRAWYAADMADAEDINSVLQKFKGFKGTSHSSFPLFFVVDYTAHKSLIMTDAIRAISGYHPREFLESRLEKLIEVYHKDDFKV